MLRINIHQAKTHLSVQTGASPGQASRAETVFLDAEKQAETQRKTAAAEKGQRTPEQWVTALEDSAKASYFEKRKKITEAKDALIANPNDPDLLTEVSLVSARCDRKREAAQLLCTAATVSGFQPLSRVEYAVQAQIEVGDVYAAIELLELDVGSPQHDL